MLLVPHARLSFQLTSHLLCFDSCKLLTVSSSESLARRLVDEVNPGHRKPITRSERQIPLRGRAGRSEVSNQRPSTFGRCSAAAEKVRHTDAMKAQVPEVEQVGGPYEHRKEQQHSNTELRSMAGNGQSALLSLPFELRRSIFEYVFLTTSSVPFPPTQRSPSRRLLGLTVSDFRRPPTSGTRPWLMTEQGPQYKLRRVDNDISSTKNGAVLISRQCYQETRLMPFQVNLVNVRAVMGSNTSVTKLFLEALQPYQRRAIRRLELHLRASVTEGWCLRSILWLIANVPTPDGVLETRSNTARPFAADSGDLQELSIFITTRDLLLSQADSLTGLLHLLFVPASTGIGGYAKTSSQFVCTASWIVDGLAHLRRLRKLKVVIEASDSVASQVSSDERDSFSTFVKSTVLGANVAIEWIVRKEMLLPVDDDEDWGNIPWLGHP